MTTQTLPTNLPSWTPDIYDPSRMGDIYTPRVTEFMERGSSAGIKPSRSDRNQKVLLLLVDPQNDFCLDPTKASLSVAGSVDDCRRIAEFIYRNADVITTIGYSLDSHRPLSIFFPKWWINAKGEHPTPGTVITEKDVRDGVWRPLHEVAWSMAYPGKLARRGRNPLLTWVYHTLIATPGHAVVSGLQETVLWHSAARQYNPQVLIKGTLPQTEHYGIFEPDVPVEDQPLVGTLNTQYLDMIGSYDLVYVAGEAKSHCVASTIIQMMDYFKKNSDFLNRMRFLVDCTSPVVIPGVLDFTDQANKQFAEFEKEGAKLVTSLDPIA